MVSVQMDLKVSMTAAVRRTIAEDRTKLKTKNQKPKNQK